MRVYAHMLQAFFADPSGCAGAGSEQGQRTRRGRVRNILLQIADEKEITPRKLCLWEIGLHCIYVCLLCVPASQRCSSSQSRNDRKREDVYIGTGWSNAVHRGFRWCVRRIRYKDDRRYCPYFAETGLETPWHV